MARAARPGHRARRAGWALAGLFLAGWIASAAVSAAEPGASPHPSASSRPSCAERFPDQGPAGVDLQLGCIVNEVASNYLGTAPASDTRPPRLSDYAGPIGLIIAGLIGFGLAVRLMLRRAGHCLVPATPAAWWSCPSCRSLNVASRTSCYRCGTANGDGSIEVRTDAEPPAPQSFGRRVGDD